MRFNRLNNDDVNALSSMVASDRLSQGDSTLNLHSKDQSKHEPSLPEAVIWPLDSREVSEILSYANNRMIPVTAWGSGSSLEGNPIPLIGGIVLDFSRMDRILDLREEDFQADVEPGLIYQDLKQPDP